MRHEFLLHNNPARQEETETAGQTEATSAEAGDPEFHETPDVDNRARHLLCGDPNLDYPRQEPLKTGISPIGSTLMRNITPARTSRANGMLPQFDWFARFVVLLVVVACSIGMGRSCDAAETRPNIVLVFIDDMGWGDFSSFGNDDAATPNIDRLASEGIRFEQFYVNSPICSPSRVAISTGQYPQRWRITSYLNNRKSNDERGMAQWLDPQAPMLARSLNQAGYATGHFGKWHMGGQRDVNDAPPITDYGFDASLTTFVDAQTGRQGTGTNLGSGRKPWRGVSVDAPFGDHVGLHRCGGFVYRSGRSGRKTVLHQSVARRRTLAVLATGRNLG